MNSKEQTPIKAEELKARILKGVSEIFKGKTIYMKDIEDDINALEQAKLNEYKDSLNVESAEEFIETQNLKIKNPMEGYIIPFSQLELIMEQYAKYREKKAVLEALEREIVKAYEFVAVNLAEHKGKRKVSQREYNELRKISKHYFETEVKPKYK